MLRRGHHAAVVDPGDAGPVSACLAREGLELTAVLITHHHHDHTGGNLELAERWGCPVIGPAAEAIPARTAAVSHGDRVTLPRLGIEFAVLGVPGHTLGHVAYYGVDMLFCGDTLFAGGCGRLFEGSPAQMAGSLRALAALPDSTRVYCAHEYTLANLAFALHVDPDNAALRSRARRERERRAAGLPTLPSDLATEKATNPFLRTTAPTLIAAASRYAGRGLDAPDAVFAALRAAKDGFRP